MAGEGQERLCAGCGHDESKHGPAGCDVAVKFDRLGYVAEVCACPLYLEPVWI